MNDDPRINKSQLEIMNSAIGKKQYGEELYACRNYYKCGNPELTKLWDELVEMGLAKNCNVPDQDMYSLTQKGLEFLGFIGTSD